PNVAPASFGRASPETPRQRGHDQGGDANDDLKALEPDDEELNDFEGKEADRGNQADLPAVGQVRGEPQSGPEEAATDESCEEDPGHPPIAKWGANQRGRLGVEQRAVRASGQEDAANESGKADENEECDQRPFSIAVDGPVDFGFRHSAWEAQRRSHVHAWLAERGCGG